MRALREPLRSRGPISFIVRALSDCQLPSSRLSIRRMRNSGTLAYRDPFLLTAEPRTRDWLRAACAAAHLARHPTSPNRLALRNVHAVDRALLRPRALQAMVLVTLRVEGNDLFPVLAVRVR